MSKGRVRIFYTGFNRNRTYISDDFANQLIASLPYTPVKGIFNEEETDYSDHGEDNTDGRIYGLVMAEPNFAWEDYLDTDGVVRTYACADVLYYTGLYPEAKLIPGQPQSMEIYRDSLVGEWRIWEDGKPYYHFLNGCLIGLQVLGMETEPCFEGAAFYSLKKDLQFLIDNVKNFSKKEEDISMEKDLFKLSFGEIEYKIFRILNPEYDGIENWNYNYQLDKIYDNYALCYNVKDNEYYRVYYSKDNDEVKVDKTEKVKLIDVTESEYEFLNSNIGITYESIVESFNKIKEQLDSFENVENDCAEVEEQETVIEENSDVVADNGTATDVETVESVEDTAVAEGAESETEAEKESFANEIEQLKQEKTVLEAQIQHLNIENEKLNGFKKNIETEQKTSILNEFSQFLSDNSIETFKSDIDKYSVEDFRKEVCTAAYDNSPSIFSRKDTETNFYHKISTDLGSDKNEPMNGAEKILYNYKKRQGGNY